MASTARIRTNAKNPFIIATQTLCAATLLAHLLASAVLAIQGMVSNAWTLTNAFLVPTNVIRMRCALIQKGVTIASACMGIQGTEPNAWM